MLWESRMAIAETIEVIRISIKRMFPIVRFVR